MARAPLLIGAASLGFIAVVACHDGSRVATSSAAAVVARPPWLEIDLPSLTACGVCHLTVYEEWEASLHHRAWTNADVRAETGDFSQAACRPCHSPQPVLLSGLDRGPDYRDFNQDDGVHCLSCHGLADGVAATRTIADAPCRPRATPGLQAATMCWPCHEPTHHAFQEYVRSDAAALGIRCADCHMPIRAGGSGRSHGPHGGLNADFVRNAVAWSVRRDGEDVVVALRNRTGHKFPGEIPSREFALRVFADGEEKGTIVLRKPAKTETRADDRLDVNELRELRVPVGPAARDVAVRLLFKSFPWLADDEAFTIGEWRSP